MGLLHGSYLQPRLRDPTSTFLLLPPHRFVGPNAGRHLHLRRKGLVSGRLVVEEEERALSLDE